MRSLDSVTFDTQDLQLEGEVDNLRQWHTADGDFVILEYFSKPPDIAAGLDDSATLRASGAGLIALDVVSVDGVPSIRLILKIPQPVGMAYVGSLTLPFRDFSYVIKVQCLEGSPTGARDTAVFTELIRIGAVVFEEGREQPTGWWADPYDPSIAAPPARNMAELPDYDARFPDHPLSRLRRILPQIETSLRMSSEVGAATPFGH